MDGNIIQQFIRALGNLDKILAKSADNAAARGFNPDQFLAARLAPDMFNLTRQVQICCDAAKATVANLSGTINPKFEDSETTLAQLRERVQKTVAHLQTVPLAAIEACPADKLVIVPFPPGGHRMTARDYLYTRQVGNFYFHLTTAYALLRMQGVPLGKADYLGPLDMLDPEM